MQKKKHYTRFFSQKCKKPESEIFVFGVITFEPIRFRPVRQSEPQFFKRYVVAKKQKWS